MAQMTVAAVKQKLMSHTGSSPSSMQLQLKDETGRLLGQMSDDSRLLGFYSPYDGYALFVRKSLSGPSLVICFTLSQLCSDRPLQYHSASFKAAAFAGKLKPYMLCFRCILHVIDTDASSKSAAGWLEDTSKVQKYVMSDEDYAKRENTYKQYKLMKQKVRKMFET